MRKVIIGIMGPGEKATASELDLAYRLGNAIAQLGWVVLTGGRKAGVMDAASRGAKAAGGLTVGILPGADQWGISEAVDIAIATDTGNGRNNINVLSSDVVVACGMGLGTASEVALALKNGKVAILLGNEAQSVAFWQGLAGERVKVARDVEDAIAMLRSMIIDN
ncbi:cytochrome [Oscillatoria sp. FACHB-1406]|uniref:SLOG cluster 4 domain-containing protein n=1 Tax=Oscillatoria sp. FACHB-1406 TaxID=2692846 RepID=UPI0016875E9D|nr:cytochrome [Oscillatoria sp. FACHB-1406]MBD2576735.1 LOG family protein [Oscillatoria sp. FACHB-1406]